MVTTVRTRSSLPAREESHSFFTSRRRRFRELCIVYLARIAIRLKPSIQDPQGLATYRYARNTPTSYSDRQGMAPQGLPTFDHLPSAEDLENAKQATRDEIAKAFKDHPDKVITKVPTVAKTVLKTAGVAGKGAGLSPVVTQGLKKATGGMTAEIPGMGIITKTGDCVVCKLSSLPM